MPAMKNVAAETASRATLGVETKGSGASTGGGDDDGDDEGVGGDDDDDGKEEEEEKGGYRVYKVVSAALQNKIKHPLDINSLKINLSIIYVCVRV